VLRKQVEMGRLLKVTAVAPVYHTPKTALGLSRHHRLQNAAIANDGYDSRPFSNNSSRSGHLQEGIAAPLRNPRCHWDLPIKDVDLDAK